MKRLRRWLIRHLTPPELGEIRHIYGADWSLTSIDYSFSLFEEGRLQLTYNLTKSQERMSTFNEVTLFGEDLET
jgi:hypothetical protein